MSAVYNRCRNDRTKSDRAAEKLPRRARWRLRRGGRNNIRRTNLAPRSRKRISGPVKKQRSRSSPGGARSADRGPRFKRHRFTTTTILYCLAYDITMTTSMTSYNVGRKHTTTCRANDRVDSNDSGLGYRFVSNYYCRVPRRRSFSVYRKLSPL